MGLCRELVSFHFVGLFYLLLNTESLLKISLDIPEGFIDKLEIMIHARKLEY